MNRLLPLLPLLLALACSDRDLCAEAPLCEENRAINCEISCTVGPCSTGGYSIECGDDATCTVHPGDLNSPGFSRSRALCVQEGSASCDPETAAAPLCDDQGGVTGCSGYKRLIRVPCAQAGVYFKSAACCRSGNPPDAGTPDGGTSPDGGP